MDAIEMRDAFDGVFDQAVLFHGFTDYMRDYEMVIDIPRSPPDAGQPPAGWTSALSVDDHKVRATDGYLESKRSPG
jgi:hypothetical protein